MSSSTIRSDAEPFTEQHDRDPAAMATNQDRDEERPCKEAAAPARRPILENNDRAREEDADEDSSDDMTELDEAMAASEPQQIGEAGVAAASETVRVSSSSSPAAGAATPMTVTNITENKTYIGTLSGPLHIGPSLNYTTTSAAPSSSTSNSEVSSRRGPADLTPSERDHIKTCSRSHRPMEMDEVERPAKQVGQVDWRSLGNALKFTYVELDHIEEQKKDDPLWQKVELMLKLWIQRHDDRATVNRLTKAFWKHNVLEAILKINP